MLAGVAAQPVPPHYFRGEIVGPSNKQIVENSRNTEFDGVSLHCARCGERFLLVLDLMRHREKCKQTGAGDSLRHRRKIDSGATSKA